MKINKKEISQESIANVISFQEHLSARMKFYHEKHLVDLIPKYQHYTNEELSFSCNANTGSFNISCHKPDMEYVCQYFNLDFSRIVNIISNVAKTCSEYRLFDYASFEKRLLIFPNYDDMHIPVILSALNNHDRPTNIRKAEINIYEKIFFHASFHYKEKPTLIMNIDFIIYFNHFVRLEVTKTIDADMVMKISSISTISSVGRSRKNYKTVSEDQLYRHMKRYAYRRLRTTVLKLLKIDKDTLVNEPELLKQYITLAEMALI